MSTPEVRRSRKGTAGVDIQIAEGNAIAWCLDDLEAEVPADQVIIIVGDNQPDIRSFHRGWSGHEGVDSIVARSASRMRGHMTILVDIDTSRNFADIDTRPNEAYTDEEIEYRRFWTVRYAKQALEVFVREGNTLHMRPDKVEQQIEEQGFDIPDDDSMAYDAPRKRNRGA